VVIVWARDDSFSESLNTVKDVAEKSISEDYDSLIKSTAKNVESDMSHDFKSYGHHMWDLKWRDAGVLQRSGAEGFRCK